MTFPFRVIPLFCVATLAAPLVQAADDPKPPVGVPADAKHFNGKWYRAYVEKGGWRRAKGKCEVLGGRLAIIPNEATNAFLKDVAGGLSLWLGGTDEKVNTVWAWIDGSRLTFTAWGAGQPQNAAKEDYLCLWKGKEWHDVFESEPLVVGYICEWPAK